MGEVYRARDTRLDRVVAIKLLPSGLASTEARRVERFRHEARAIARITHPNICTLHDVGEDGSTVFLVMEYVDGVTLARRLEDGPLPLPLALRTATGIADALDYAHRSGVVHRDLKPANVMLTRDSVKLLDFGLARLTEHDEQTLRNPTKSVRLTDAGTIIGTVPYMAPEQIEGREVDARTDIFALGVILYEMISGRRPFFADSRASLMAAVVAAEPPPLSSLQPRIPDSLERLVRRCLAKDPDDRWQTARDLAAELRWIADASPAMASGRPDVARGRPRAALWGALTGSALTAAVIAALVLPLWPRPNVPLLTPVTFRKGIVPSARFTTDGNFVYSASWDGHAYATFLGRLGAGDARDLLLTDSRILSVSRAGDMAVLFGPQNSTHTFGERLLASIPMAGGARRDMLTGVVDADWIPGTDSLAVVRDPGDGGLWTVEFPAGKTVYTAQAAWSLRVSPDGRRVAFFEGPELFASAPNAMVTVVDRAGNRTPLTGNWAGFGLAWAPSGSEIWFTATRPGLLAPHIRAVSLSGRERAVYTAPDWLVLHDISSAGRVLLSRNSIRVSLVCKPRDAAAERDLTWYWAAFATSLSRDGETVIFEDELAGNPIIYRRGVDGSPAIEIGDGTGGALSPDGKWVLALSGGNAVLLPTGIGDRVTLSKGDVKRIEGGSWLGDSKRVVFTGYHGDGTPRVYVQEIPSGLPQPISPSGAMLARRAAVRDDNSLLARVGNAWTLLPIQGGGIESGRPVAGLKPADIPLQWSQDGRHIYYAEGMPGARPSAVDVFRVELATGNRVRWKTLAPSDPVGVEDMRESVVLTPDAQAYCYSYLRRLGDLFIADGLE
jgi:hypothetical protein